MVYGRHIELLTMVYKFINQQTSLGGGTNLVGKSLFLVGNSTINGHFQ